MADYDYIIVGGGSAGCALANRVSEDPAAHVLLLGSRPTRRFDVDRHPGGLHEPAQPRAALFKKSEHYEPGGDGTGSRGGPLNVAALRERAELDDAFIDAAVAEGFPRNPDYNNGNQRGFG